MKKVLINKLLSAALLIIMTANIFMLIQIRILMNTTAILREIKESYILPDGFTPSGTKITWNESSTPPSGWVVRYASNGCIYCKLDHEWERLAYQLEQENFRIITLLPNEMNQFDDAQIIPKTARQMVFIKMDWAKQFRFIGTPSVIIFDNNGHVLWHRTGMLNDVDYVSAKKVVLRKIK